jgi:hypothetical protein
VHRFHNYRFGIVLGLILASITFELAAPDSDTARLVAVALQGLTLVAAVVASRAHPWVVRLAIAGALLLFASAAAFVLGTDEFGSDSAQVVNLLLVVLASPAIVYGLVRNFREEGRITIHAMFGVLCLYLLLGLLFASAFNAIQAVSNDPFFATGSGGSQDFIYFSFTTITTTGYGDLTAATDLGRSLANTEAQSGQIYLVTVVALIVGNLRARPAGPR